MLAYMCGWGMGRGWVGGSGVCLRGGGGHDLGRCRCTFFSNLSQK